MKYIVSNEFYLVFWLFFICCACAEDGETPEAEAEPLVFTKVVSESKVPDMNNLTYIKVGNEGFFGLGTPKIAAASSLAEWYKINLESFEIQILQEHPGGRGRGNLRAASVVDGKIFMGGGRIDFLQPAPEPFDFWQYDSENNQWSEKAPLPDSSAYFLHGFSNNDTVYVATTLGTVWRYDLLQDNWNAENSLQLKFDINNGSYCYFGSESDFIFSIADTAYSIDVNQWIYMHTYEGYYSNGWTKWSRLPEPGAEISAVIEDKDFVWVLDNGICTLTGDGGGYSRTRSPYLWTFNGTQWNKIGEIPDLEGEFNFGFGYNNTLILAYSRPVCSSDPCFVSHFLTDIYTFEKSN